MPRISFVQRKTDVFSVFGTKFTYRQIHDIVYQHAPVTSFMQVILEDGASGTDMKLILPDEEGHGVKERRDEIYNALKSHPSMSFIVSQGVLDFHLEFVAADFFTSRKIRKVEDRRGGAGESAAIQPLT
jgi:phenylacetate-coenzyme A ligase PaaK-like adenylate-forming protein